MRFKWSSFSDLYFQISFLLKFSINTMHLIRWGDSAKRVETWGFKGEATYQRNSLSQTAENGEELKNRHWIMNRLWQKLSQVWPWPWLWPTLLPGSQSCWQILRPVGSWSRLDLRSRNSFIMACMQGWRSPTLRLTLEGWKLLRHRCCQDWALTTILRSISISWKDPS